MMGLQSSGQALLSQGFVTLIILHYHLVQTQSPVFISPTDRVGQLFPQAVGSLSVASYTLNECGGGILSRLNTVDISRPREVLVKLRLTVSRSVYPGVGPSTWAHDQILSYFLFI